MKNDFSKLENIAKKIRYRLVDISNKTRSAHLASSLSCVDILVALYWKILNVDNKKPQHPDRDRFILSKGHAANSLYTVLSEKGFIPASFLDLIGNQKGKLEEHPGCNINYGIENSSGSLGHGLSLGIGMALSAKILEKKFKIYVLLSDGECNEGSVWEAAMFAPAHKLNNLTAIVDFNKWQATGRSCDVMSLQPLKKKWESFGWDTYEINGHNYTEIISAFNKENFEKPKIIVANTIKGKGISFMEDDNNWHYRIPTEEEVGMVKKELGLK